MNSTSGRMSRLDAVTLALIATGAVSIGFAVLTAAISRVVEIFGSPVALDLPVHDVPMPGAADAAGLASAEFTEASASFTQLDAGIRWLLVGETMLPALSTVLVCATLWWLGFSLIRQRAFRKSMVPVLATAGLGLIIAGMVGPLLGGIARAEAVKALPAPVSDPFWTFLVQLDLSPIGWGIALALVAAAFEVGQRMQKDMEGLV
ncbi:hypothetical protein Q9R19_14360 [Microbacterium sp. ARD32]|uniref:hypothetical protein n=1 Tax=Microbacterium sp. ARD32 TaxID=2962577 RepID=UPI002882B0DD|nr:hypothetical protein [Microbacterium sp. ARD32]MDT0158810.1 hypothetical protein [Microbacterium sp. ARD32]